MNPLLDAKDGTLYRLDGTFLSKVRYSTSSNLITFIIPDPPQFELPDSFHLAPVDTKNESKMYVCTLTGNISEYLVESTQMKYYVVEAAADAGKEQREDLRVEVSLEAEASFSRKKMSIEIKNISAGGMLFHASIELEKDDSFTVICPEIGITEPISTVVVAERNAPSPDLRAYSCRFTALSPRTETALRNFVFQQDLIQHRRKKS